MGGASLGGRTPDRRDFLIGISGVPRSEGEAGDRPSAGDFPWRATSGCLPGVTIQQCSSVTLGAGSGEAAAGEARANDGHQTLRTVPSNLMTRGIWAVKDIQKGDRCSAGG